MVTESGYEIPLNASCNKIKVKSQACLLGLLKSFLHSVIPLAVVCISWSRYCHIKRNRNIIGMPPLSMFPG